MIKGGGMQYICSAGEAKAQTFALLSLHGRFAVSARPALQEATRADIPKQWP